MPYPELLAAVPSGTAEAARRARCSSTALDGRAAAVVVDAVEASTAPRAAVAAARARRRDGPGARGPRRRSRIADAGYWSPSRRCTTGPTSGPGPRRLGRGARGPSCAIFRHGAYVGFLRDEGPARVRPRTRARLGPAGGDQGRVRPRQPLPAQPERPARDRGGRRLARPAPSGRAGDSPCPGVTRHGPPPHRRRGDTKRRPRLQSRTNTTTQSSHQAAASTTRAITVVAAPTRKANQAHGEHDRGRRGSSGHAPAAPPRPHGRARQGRRAAARAGHRYARARRRADAARALSASKSPFHGRDAHAARRLRRGRVGSPQGGMTGHVRLRYAIARGSADDRRHAISAASCARPSPRLGASLAAPASRHAA